MADLSWSWEGAIPYQQGIAMLESKRNEVLRGQSDGHLFLMEHPPVITLGKSARKEDVIADALVLEAKGVEVVRTSRGGDVTFHGPGQLMVYPVVRITHSLTAFLENIAAALSQVLSALGVPGATWKRSPAGLWLGDKKIAACGIHVHRRVMIHGFAVNLSTAKDWWSLILPCGLKPDSLVSLGDAMAGEFSTEVAAVAKLAGPVISAALGFGREKLLG